MSIIPVDKKTKIMFSKTQKVPYFSDEEIKAIFEYLLRKIDENKGKMRKKYETYYLLTKMLYRTGARIEEIIGGIKQHTDKKSKERQYIQFEGIRPKDIDFYKNEINIPTLKHKTIEYRTLAIHPDLKEALLQYFLNNHIDQKSAEPIFRIKRQTYNKFLDKMSRDLGFKIHPHKFRHTVAIKMIQNGVPLNHIQKTLGHSSILTTSVYLETLNYKNAILNM